MDLLSRMTFSRVTSLMSNVVHSEEDDEEAADWENGGKRTDSYARMASVLAGERLLSVCQAPRSVPGPTPFKAKCGGSGFPNGEPALDHQLSPSHYYLSSPWPPLLQCHRICQPHHR